MRDDSVALAGAPIAVSVLTPVWNRASLLERVHAGLLAQGEIPLEWIVADDGSSDDPLAVVSALAQGSNFPIRFLQAEAHVGKARMDNAAIAAARGEMILWCDSDDVLVPGALATLLGTWRSIPRRERVSFVGVTALAATEEGVIADPLPGVTGIDLGWNDLTEVHGLRADAVYMIRADILKNHPFPEVDLVVPEGVIWSALGHYPARFTSQVVKRVEYRSPGAVSFSGRMAYNRGRAYALALSDRHLRAYRKPRLARLQVLFNFIRYALHGEIGLLRARRLWKENRDEHVYWALFPFAMGAALIDRLRGKVVRSHRVFDANLGASINSILINEGR